MRLVLVANPAAGSAETEIVNDVVAELRRIGRVERLSPNAQGAIPRRRVASGDVVVVGGGDGSLHHVVNALGDALDDVAFALVPLGTGNDLARTLGVPLDPVDAARALADAVTREVDVGVATTADGSRLFVNACLGGFPVDVDDAIDESLKRTFGSLAFVVGGARALGELERARVTAGGRTVEGAVAFAIGNGRTAGGGIPVWPEADVADGLLDACVLGGDGALGLARLGAAVRAGRHADLDGVVAFRARRIEVESDPPIPFNLDGEVLGFSTPASFEIARRLRVLVPS